MDDIVPRSDVPDEDRICLDEEADALSEHRRLIAFVRAERALGIVREDVDDPEATYDSSEFHEEYARQVIRLVVDDMTDGFAERGILEVSGVAADGTLVYRRGPAFTEAPWADA